ncbi:MAG: VWA domain-containing protein [Kiritimatiellales bacterium]
MRFGAPEFIKWLLLIIPLIVLFIWMHRQRAVRLARLISSNVWETVIPGHSRKSGRRRIVLRLLALLCIGLALTRPQWGSHWEEVKQRGLDIIVVLDTSKSMLAEDIKPNRLKQAQWAVRDFVKQLKGDRIGLIAFAGSSFLQCPVTIDYAAFTMMLDDIYAGIIPRGGTAIEQALKTAADSFDTKSEADRVIILITDGEDHEGDPMRMAEQLRKDKIKLFCIGVGTLEGELVPSTEGYVKNPQGQVVKSSLNEGLLEKLASETGGFYVRSAPGDFGLDRIYKLGISGLQRNEQETRLAKVYEERFGWFAAAALLFLLTEGLFRPAAILIFLTLMSAPQANAADWVKAYKNGDYTNAFQALEKTAEKFPDIGNYNRGNVLYREKDFQGSEKAYSSAAAQTANEQLKQKALYNRGTALLAGTTQQKDPAQVDAKITAATQATGFFEQALSLKPDDLAAKQNLERAIKLKEQLEQQKKEQEKQQQQDKNQQKKDQQQNQDQQQQSGQDKQKDEKKQQQDQQNQRQDEQKQSDQSKQSDQNKEQPQPSRPQQAGEMSEQEAQQLLDAMKQDEQDRRANLKPFLGGPVRVEKDW